MRNTRTWWWIIGVLFVAIIAMMIVLFALPIPTHPNDSITATTTQSAKPGPTTTIPVPLSSKVVVTTPSPSSHVGPSFIVAGQAPGQWFFEAQFPIQVRDAQGNVIGRATGSAQGDWQTTSLVTFTATMHIDSSYHGSATLILMKDNPSGLPENDDSVEIPIVIE